MHLATEWISINICVRDITLYAFAECERLGLVSMGKTWDYKAEGHINFFTELRKLLDTAVV